MKESPTVTKVQALRFSDDRLELLDQRALPGKVEWLSYTRSSDVGEAIADLVVRGAPAIGVSAAYGLALEAAFDPDANTLKAAAAELESARPTAINLAWAVKRVLATCLEVAPEDRAAAALAEARSIHDEDIAACAAMAANGADLIPGDGPIEILTHCNAGALATAGIGSALGVVREIAARGRLARVWSLEARPIQQGARLTSWECLQDELPVTLLADSAAGWLFSSGRLAAVVVGADRIAADGSVANKIGTYQVAVLAARHGVPMLVAAPTSTLDLSVEGTEIPIELRDGDEMRLVRGQQVAPVEVEVANPAFDLTPPELVTAVITETGVSSPPSREGLRRLLDGRSERR